MFEVTEKSVKSTTTGYTASVNGEHIKIKCQDKDKKDVKMVVVAYAENEEVFDARPFESHSDISTYLERSSYAGYSLNMVIIKV